MDLQALTPYILIALGCLTIVIPFVKKFPAQMPPPSWLHSDGIVFQLGYKDENAAQSMDTITKNKITIRFLTQKQEWITEDLNTDGMILYMGQFKTGQAVDVVYNPDNPVEFTIVTNQSPTMQKLFWVLAGAVCLGVGVYQLVTARK